MRPQQLTQRESKLLEAWRLNEDSARADERDQALAEVSAIICWLTSPNIDRKYLLKQTVELFDRASTGLPEDSVTRGNVKFYKEFAQ